MAEQRDDREIEIGSRTAAQPQTELVWRIKLPPLSQATGRIILRRTVAEETCEIDWTVLPPPAHPGGDGPPPPPSPPAHPGARKLIGKWHH